MRLPLDIGNGLLYIIVMNARKQYLTQAEVAKKLNLTRQRVGQFVRDGRLSAVRISRYVLITPAALDKFQKIERRNGFPRGKKRVRS